MISVVLYGRNDSHGYNLHKRGALSLNCIAELLDGKDDEIIFVDYNSPDQIPTFPEAIADTLTDRAARLLRIIRVRESYHRNFVGRTHLVALESQSRNIAIRRANPANKWILSTNSDMIFTSRIGEKSLTDCVAQLADGFYHLPRFEIPESLWESFDRLDPRAAISKLRDWGRTLHLNEVVFGGYDNVYEAPGDFQLFLRSDLEKIGGFDESMIRGWHVDSNIARRMKLLRGEVRSAIDSVFGYHCGHTRQPTSLHRSGFVANSLDTYVREVSNPVLQSQLDIWGAPDIEFEERRISRGTRSMMEQALASAIPAPGPELSEVTLNEASFDVTDYEASHVLPHLVNLLGEMPQGQCLVLMGNDGELFLQLARSLDALALKSRLLWVDGPQDCTFAGAVAIADGLSQGDVFLLQFPAYDNDHSPGWAEARWRAQRELELLIADERRRPVDERRLVVLVNAAHTALQDTFLPAMSFTAIPYTARLRHGFVTLPQADERSHAPLPGNRIRPFHEDDVALAKVILQQDALLPGWERLSLDLADLIEQSQEAVDDPIATKRLAEARHHVQTIAQRCVEPAVAVADRDVSAARLASSVDWENPDWLALAERSFGGPAVYAQGARSRWTWERVALIHNLRQRVDERTRPWVLVVANGPDCLPTLVAHLGYRVAYASYARLMTGTPDDPAKWQETLRVWNMINHADIIPLDTALAQDVGRFAAVLIAGTDISAGGVQRFDETISNARKVAADDAYIAATAQVHLNAGSGGALSFAEWKAAFAHNGVAARNGLAPAGEFDPRIPLDCVVRFSPEDATQYIPGLSFGWGDAMVTIGLIDGWLDVSHVRKAHGLPKANPVVHQDDPSAPPADATRLASIPSAPAMSGSEALPPLILARAVLTNNEPFACRVLSDLPRDLSRFVRPFEETEDNEWWLLPVEVPASGQLKIAYPGGLVLGVVDYTGEVAMVNAQSATGDTVTIDAPAASRAVIILSGRSLPSLRVG